jgi:hypothetical protein
VLRVPLTDTAAEPEREGTEAPIADGTLQVLALPPPPDSVDEDEQGSHLALAISPQTGGCSFFCLCPPGTAIAVALGHSVLVVPDPDHNATGPAKTACGIVFGTDGLKAVATCLQKKGRCKVSWQANKEAHIAANAAVLAGNFLAGAVIATSEAMGKGVRCASNAAISSELISADEVSLPPSARKGVQLARKGSLMVAKATGFVVSGLATAAGKTAAVVHEQMPDLTEQWQEDAKVVGKSALEAGVTVWHAVQEATQHLASEVAEASSEVAGHRFGEEVGTATRDSLHAVGNVYLATSLMSLSGAGQMTAAGTAQGLADSIDQKSQPPPPALVLPPLEQVEVYVEDELSIAPCTEPVEDKYLGY